MRKNFQCKSEASQVQVWRNTTKEIEMSSRKSHTQSINYNFETQANWIPPKAFAPTHPQQTAERAFFKCHIFPSSSVRSPVYEMRQFSCTLMHPSWKNWKIEKLSSFILFLTEKTSRKSSWSRKEIREFCSCLSTFVNSFWDSFFLSSCPGMARRWARRLNRQNCHVLFLELHQRRRQIERKKNVILLTFWFS